MVGLALGWELGHFEPDSGSCVGFSTSERTQYQNDFCQHIRRTSQTSDQSYKISTYANYDISNNYKQFSYKFDSRVVIYYCRGSMRLTTNNSINIFGCVCKMIKTLVHV